MSLYMYTPVDFLEFSRDSYRYAFFFLAMIKQYLSDVCWVDLDFQLIGRRALHLQV